MYWRVARIAFFFILSGYFVACVDGLVPGECNAGASRAALCQQKGNAEGFMGIGEILFAHVGHKSNGETDLLGVIQRATPSTTFGDINCWANQGIPCNFLKYLSISNDEIAGTKEIKRMTVRGELGDISQVGESVYNTILTSPPRHIGTMAALNAWLDREPVLILVVERTTDAGGDTLTPALLISRAKVPSQGAPAYAADVLWGDERDRLDVPFEKVAGAAGQPTRYQEVGGTLKTDVVNTPFTFGGAVYNRTCTLGTEPLACTITPKGEDEG